MVTPDQFAARWVSGLQGATTKIQEGIAGVTVAPGQLAARQKAAYVAGVNASQDRWARNVQNVTLQDWQRLASDKGVPRISAGASAAQNRMQQVGVKLLPAIQSAVSSLPPRGNFE